MPHKGANIPSLEIHKPFTRDTVDLVTEAIGLGTYINLAQGLQVIGEIVASGGECGIDNLIRVMETMTEALFWMDRAGLADRHPDLMDMPHKVQPLDFQGGVEGIREWLGQEMERLINREDEKIRNYMN